MNEPRVRIRDIAEELGLSTATVSNVIHGKTGKVSDATARRVQQLLEQRRYIPNMAGILLAQNSSGIIGVAVYDHEKYEGKPLADDFIASALSELSRQIDRAGKFMMVKTVRQPDDLIAFASMWNMQALVLIGFCRQDYARLRENMRIGLVAYDAAGDMPPGSCSIGLDDFDGGRQVGRHFRSLGHRRALCIADNDEHVDHARRNGFAAGFGPGADFWQIPMDARERLSYYEAHLSALRAYSAVFAVSDVYALELMRFLPAHGVRVPQEVSVAGFDDTPACTRVYPALTSVRQDSRARAALALKRIAQLQSGEPVEPVCRLPVQLIARESTAHPGVPL